MTSVPSAPPLPPAENKSEPLFIKSIENKDCLYNLDSYYKKCITPVSHVPQSGPNCGLAALAMVAMQTPRNLSLVDIFDEAKARGYTNNGEMFSVKNTKTLAETILSPWFKVEMFSGGLAYHKSLILERLYNGDLMLIPYDADKDHRPCCVKGHKAHWALVCGVMTTAEGEEYVAARQGKSRLLAVWSLDSLQHSNDNLTELDPSRASDDFDYILPTGGLTDGLAGKFILLHKETR